MSPFIIKKFTTKSNMSLPHYSNLIYLTGFNIIKFDEAIKTPDGTSTKDWIIKKYGKEAGDLIDWLIKHTGLPE